MIVEDEKDDDTIHINLNQTPGTAFVLPPEVNVGGNICFADVLRRKAAIRARPQRTQLKNDLIEHIYDKFKHTLQNLPWYTTTACVFLFFFLINMISNTCIFISGPFHDGDSASGTSC
jgi:hypothetical protein